MKSFDDIFRRNVNRAFGNYNADHLADKGWDSFVASRKKARRIGGGFPLWAKAASIVLLAGSAALTGYLVINRESADKIPSVSGTGPAKEIPSANMRQPEPADLPAIAEIAVAERGIEVIRNDADLREKDVSGESAGEIRQYRQATPSYIETIILPEVAEYRPQITVDSLNQVFEEALKNFLESESGGILAEEEAEKTEKTTVIAGVSGLLTHVEDAASAAPGVSMGFYLDRKITSRISFRPGLALAVNSVGIDNSSGYNKLAYSVPLVDGNSGTLDSYNGQLSVLAMELPLNFVFNVFKRGRSGIYLTAGTSTLIYFSQQFSGDFVNEYTMSTFDELSGSMSSETRYSTVEVSNDYGTSNRTDLFGLINFSAGYSLPYGETGTMLIEPFMQLPVTDLTALNLRVRYGGLSVKIHFGARKSKE